MDLILSSGFLTHARRTQHVFPGWKQSGYSQIHRQNTRCHRSEIIGLDRGRGCIEIFDKGLLVTLRGRLAGSRSRPGSSSPVAKGLRRVRGQGKDVGPDGLNDQEVTRLVKKVLAAVSAATCSRHAQPSNTMI
ncbi:hypothetical protein [Rhizobium sp. N324]|uniref:hypothetical protein n=1 Tax=Rhizobium sp. N324 TaxID=1703969 RepID=UPI0007F061DB|nr:hypothetical protein AMK05_PB00001 [Rhizobium sp. N324]ANM19537.1 hypothetical protein AMK06_PB00001 [Rhizobium sp. N541]ANM25922.1 hypothetical protein AMK07_PB00001 [Rhizobium sp. N941]OYD00931.1 hypothetical protein AMK08_PB00001 [Rhizobium sp. N4311]